MQRVFISNTKVREEGSDIVFNSAIGIEQLPRVEKSGKTTFIIDVHCTFNEAKKMQQHGGVIIYRHLLKQFEKFQDNLKVVFYSPLSAKYLYALRPENYVLTLLPFVELFPDGETDWQFEKALQAAEKLNCLPFNNASENLLSGWAFAEKQSVQTNFLSKEEGEKSLNEQIPKKRSIAIIDDQLNEWETTFRKVFEPKSELRFLPYDKSKGTPNKFERTKIDKLTDQVKDVDMVLSDFYLEEPHESNKWMSLEELSDKSGFQLFEVIKGRKGEKGISKGVPYVMHTSSNKIQYYKFLDANGVDNWLIKDTRPDTDVQQKKENYLAFKREIETYTSLPSSELYFSLRELHKPIELIESWVAPISWWDAKSKKPAVINLLKNSWMALRAFANKEEYFATNIGSVDKNFTPASVNSNLGKILEMFDFGNTLDLNYFFHFLTQIRNSSSHYVDYPNFEITDSVIYLESWLHALQMTKDAPRKAFKTQSQTKEFMIQDNGKGTDETFTYRLLYVYLQYYNSNYSKDNFSSKSKIKKRAKELLKLTDKKILLDEILNHNMPLDKFGDVREGAVHLSEFIAKDLINDPSLDFDLDDMGEPGKLFIINE